MNEPVRLRPTVRNRLCEGPFGLVWEDLTQALQTEGYTATTIRRYLRTGVRFGEWLVQHHIPVADISAATVEQYRQHCGRLPSGRLPKAAQGLPHLLALLRAQGVVRTDDPSGKSTACEQWLQRYAHYLHTVKGAAESTCDTYLRSVRRLLTQCFPTDQVQWETVTAQQIVTFVQQEAARHSGLGRRIPAVAVRAALRFAVFSGERVTGLADAIPLPRLWKHAALPAQLTPAEVERVLHRSRGTSPTALRDYAILLLLARLGLRAHEVGQLHLDDIQWATGQLLIRSGTAHQVRCLPLSQEVGDALVAYLTSARPASTSRQVFVRLHPPFQPFVRSSGISRLVRQAFERADLPPHPRLCAQLLRQTAAARMVQQGATLKTVADVLGHRSLHTTSLYTKLDFPALTEVALPWIGGAQ